MVVQIWVTQSALQLIRLLCAQLDKQYMLICENNLDTTCFLFANDIEDNTFIIKPSADVTIGLSDKHATLNQIIDTKFIRLQPKLYIKTVTTEDINVLRNLQDIEYGPEVFA